MLHIKFNWHCLLKKMSAVHFKIIIFKFLKWLMICAWLALTILMCKNLLCYPVNHYVKSDNSSNTSKFIRSFIPLACAECNNSLPFSGASSIPLRYVLFSCHPSPPTVLPSSLTSHLAIYFLLYLSIFLFPNSHIYPVNSIKQNSMFRPVFLNLCETAAQWILFS